MVATFLATLFGSGSSAGVIPDQEFHCRTEASEPVRLPAQGDALSFKVFLAYQWRGYAVSEDDLRAQARQQTPKARHTVAVWLRPIAREYAPHRSRELEEEIARRLAEHWQRLTDGERELKFKASARVEPDDVVLEQLRPYWAARIKADCDHELHLQRAEQADLMTRRWSEIFARLQRDPRAAFAAKLSEQEFAEVFKDFVGSGDKSIEDLVTLLESAVRGHENLDLGPSEYTRAWDAAIRAFQLRHGVPPTSGAEV